MNLLVLYFSLWSPFQAVLCSPNIYEITENHLSLERWLNVKGANCSSTGPEFGSQHPYWMAHSCLNSSLMGMTPLASQIPLIILCMCAHVHKHTHAHILSLYWFQGSCTCAPTSQVQPSLLNMAVNEGKIIAKRKKGGFIHVALLGRETKLVHPL